MKLWQLIKSHLGPYRNVLLMGVVLFSVVAWLGCLVARRR